MVGEVFSVERLAHAVLGDDVEIASVEVRIALHACALGTLSEDHVGRDEAAGVRSAQHHAALRQVLQHIVAIFPPEPMPTLVAEFVIEKQRPHRQREKPVAHPRQSRRASKKPEGTRDKSQPGQQRKDEIRVGVVGHLQPPTGIVDRGPIRHWLQDRRENERDLEEINPSPRRHIAQPQHHNQCHEVGHHTEWRKTHPQLRPKKSNPLLKSLQKAPFGQTAGILGGRFGMARSAHEFPERAEALFRETPAVLRAVEGKIKTLRSPRVGPIHRRVRRGGQRHVGVGEKAENDDKWQIRNQAPLDSEFF